MTDRSITVASDEPMARERLHALCVGTLAVELYKLGRDQDWILGHVKLCIDREIEREQRGEDRLELVLGAEPDDLRPWLCADMPRAALTARIGDEQAIHQARLLDDSHRCPVA